MLFPNRDDVIMVIRLCDLTYEPITVAAFCGSTQPLTVFSLRTCFFLQHDQYHINITSLDCSAERMQKDKHTNHVFNTV